MRHSPFSWVRSLFTGPSSPRSDQEAPARVTRIGAPPDGEDERRLLERAGVKEGSGRAPEQERTERRDTYLMGSGEFRRSVEESYRWEAQLKPTTSALPRSRLLSREAEAAVLGSGAAGVPDLQLVQVNGQLALGLPDGRLVDPRSSSIYRYDVIIIRVRGRAYQGEANLAVTTEAGTRLELRREPGNEHDPNAIAVIAPGTGQRFGYVNKLNA